MSLSRAARAPARSASDHQRAWRGVAHRRARHAPLARASSDDKEASDDDASSSSISPVDLRVLQERMETIRAREKSLDVLRILVLDASVPKQVLPLHFDGDNVARELNAGTRLGEDVELGDAFGMLGQAPSNGQILPNGVEVVVTRLMTKPTGETLVELTASRRFKIIGSPFEDENRDGAPSARVAWIDESEGAGEQMVQDSTTTTTDGETVDPSSCDDEAKALAMELPGLVDEWRALVVSRKRERQPDQLKLIMSHLGPMPSIDRPAELACWVAGLINPIPALGVAYEIRPALLISPTVGDMVRVSHRGISLSIENLRNSPQI